MTRGRSEVSGSLHHFKGTAKATTLPYEMRVFVRTAVRVPRQERRRPSPLQSHRQTATRCASSSRRASGSNDVAHTDLVASPLQSHRQTARCASSSRRASANTRTRAGRRPPSATSRSARSPSSPRTRGTCSRTSPRPRPTPSSRSSSIVRSSEPQEWHTQTQRKVFGPRHTNDGGGGVTPSSDRRHAACSLSSQGLRGRARRAVARRAAAVAARAGERRRARGRGPRVGRLLRVGRLVRGGEVGALAMAWRVRSGALNHDKATAVRPAAVSRRTRTRTTPSSTGATAPAPRSTTWYTRMVAIWPFLVVVKRRPSYH